MILAVPPKRWKAFQTLMKRRGVEATVIGRFTTSGKCVVSYHGTTVMDVDMDFLHNGLPVKHLQTSAHKPKKIIAGHFHPSFSFISQQYDHEVQGTSVLKPLQGRGRVNGDAVVLKPMLSSNRGFVASHALYPSYGDVDPYLMAAAAIDTAIRNIVCAGADPERIALLDNFCWCDSTNPVRLGQLKRAAQACYDYAVFYGTPFISGKDSMFNDFHGFDEKGEPVSISIPPTLLISAIGIMDDVQKAVSLDAKAPGDIIYLLGKNTTKNKKLYAGLASCIQKGLIASAQSVHHGGLAIAIAKTLIGGMLGAQVTFEPPGTVLVTVSPANKKQFEQTLRGNACAQIGTITDGPRVRIGVISTTIDRLKKSYEKTFQSY